MKGSKAFNFLTGYFVEWAFEMAGLKNQEREFLFEPKRTF